MKIVIEVEPEPQRRVAYSRYGGAYGKAHKRNVDYKKRVREELTKQGTEPFGKEIPLKVEVVFIRGYLKSWTKKKLQEAKEGILYPITRPDVDNYSKAILDCANGLLWDDDSQIIELNARKEYDEIPRIEIVITALN